MANKRTFIVLFGVEIHDARKLAENIENFRFEIGGSVQATANDVRNYIVNEQIVICEHDKRYVHVYPITDFMDAFNNEEINDNNYFMSYVQA